MAKISKDELEIYFQYGVDITNRRIFLHSDIDEESISAVIQGMYLMDSYNKNPVTLFVGSYGGDVYSMFSLHDITRTLESPIHTVAYGKAMSAAPLLVACGERNHRTATENTFFMIHEGHFNMEEKIRSQQAKSEIKHQDDLAKRWCELMAKYSKRNAAHWKKLCDKVGDTYFNVETALEWGLIDYIWDEKEGEDE